MAQIFANDQGFTKITPMTLKTEAGYAIDEMIQDVGIPKHLHTDDAKKLTAGTWKKVCKESRISMSNTEPYSPWQKRAEGRIREVKRHVQ